MKSERGETTGAVIAVLVGITLMWTLFAWLVSGDISFSTYVVDTGKKTVLQRDYLIQRDFSWKLLTDDDKPKQTGQYQYTYEEPSDLPREVLDDVRPELGNEAGVYPVVPDRYG